MGILHALYGQDEDFWATGYSTNPQKVSVHSLPR